VSRSRGLAHLTRGTQNTAIGRSPAVPNVTGNSIRAVIADFTAATRLVRPGAGVDWHWEHGLDRTTTDIGDETLIAHHQRRPSTTRDPRGTGNGGQDRVTMVTQYAVSAHLHSGAGRSLTMATSPNAALQMPSAALHSPSVSVGTTAMQKAVPISTI
jgi:hypothetical protein